MQLQSRLFTKTNFLPVPIFRIYAVPFSFVFWFFMALLALLRNFQSVALYLCMFVSFAFIHSYKVRYTCVRSDKRYNA